MTWLDAVWLFNSFIWVAFILRKFVKQQCSVKIFVPFFKPIFIFNFLGVFVFVVDNFEFRFLNKSFEGLWVLSNERDKFRSHLIQCFRVKRFHRPDFVWLTITVAKDVALPLVANYGSRTLLVHQWKNFLKYLYWKRTYQKQSIAVGQLLVAAVTYVLSIVPLDDFH